MEAEVIYFSHSFHVFFPIFGIVKDLSGAVGLTIGDTIMIFPPMRIITVHYFWQIPFHHNLLLETFFLTHMVFRGESQAENNIS